MILSTNKSEQESSSSAMKQEVNFCSDHLSDFLEKASTCNKSNHLRIPRRYLIHFFQPLKISTKECLSLLNKRHNNSSNLAINNFIIIKEKLASSNKSSAVSRENGELWLLWKKKITLMLAKLNIKYLVLVFHD